MQIIVVLDDHAGAKLGRRNSHCKKTPYFDGGWLADAGRPHFPPDTRLESFILHGLGIIGKIHGDGAL
jgi:hypothetical protein